MPHYIFGNTMDELFAKTSKILIEKGHENSPRGLKTLELNDVFLELSDPTKAFPMMPERGASKEYLDKEMAWYLSGSLWTKDAAACSKFWEKLGDSNETINSNYGFICLVEKWNGISQLQWCIHSLRKDPDTRQAVINYSQPKYKYEGNKDQICTLNQLFVKRNNKLESIVLMRSNDLIRGLTYDASWFCYLQKKISEETGISMGSYKHYAASLHVYQEHWDMLKAMAATLGKYKGEGTA